MREISRAMFDAWLQARPDETVSLARRLVRTLTEGVEPPEVTDPRIMSAIVYVNQHLDRAITLDEVASYACLSPGRFRHVFAEQVGMGLRPYILWRRFMLAWELIMKGWVPITGHIPFTNESSSSPSASSALAGVTISATYPSS